MTQLAGTPGPHVFVETLEAMRLSSEDLAHLSKSLRMRDGDPLTVSDGDGAWCPARFSSSGVLAPTGSVTTVPRREVPITVAFSLLKANKSEMVIQKLTELGVDNIVVLAAERSIVNWDEAKIAKAKLRWGRIAREAAMQSHRVRLPDIEGLESAASWLARSHVAVAHFDGTPGTLSNRSIAIGPEGGWSDSELNVATSRIALGPTVLRAETAAIAAGALLTARSTYENNHP